MLALTMFVALCCPAGASLHDVAVENVTLRVELHRIDGLYESLRQRHEKLEGEHEDLVSDFADLKADYEHLLAARQAAK